MRVNLQVREWVSSEAKQRTTRWLQDVPIPVQKGKCFNSCLSVTFLLSHTWEKAPRTWTEWGHHWYQLYICIQTNYLFPLNEVAAWKQNQSRFSEDDYLEAARERLRAVLHLFRVNTGMWGQQWAVQGNSAGIALLEQFVGRTCCGSQGQRGFWVSTKVAGTDRENTRKFSAFLVEKWKQVKNEGGDRTAWWGTATAELRVLSVKSRESEAITKWDFICGCAFGGTGHPLHLPPCITIKHQTKALNLHLGQQEPFLH